MAERIVTGIKELDRALAKLADRKAANRAARSGLAKGARLAAKKIKQQVPSRYKGVRAAIGSSVKKSKANGETVAKAGAAVGKKKSISKRSEVAGRKTRRLKSLRDKSTGRFRKAKKSGVGISASNIHWWILGTKERRTGTGRFTGSMPGHAIVKRAMSGSESEIQKAIIAGVEVAMAREVKKAIGK